MSNGTVALDFLDFLPPTDSANEVISKVYDLKIGVRALAYQVTWDAPASGQFIFEATIFDGKWETLVDCEEVRIDSTPGTAGHSIVVIPKVWLVARFLRFRWVPTTGTPSSGNISAALRVLRI